MTAVIEQQDRVPSLPHISKDDIHHYTSFYSSIFIIGLGAIIYATMKRRRRLSSKVSTPSTEKRPGDSLSKRTRIEMPHLAFK